MRTDDSERALLAHPASESAPNVADMSEAPASETPQALSRGGQAAAGRFLTVADIAQILHCSPRTIHELTRTCRIPHRRIAGTRRCLFVRDEVDAWLNGAELYVLETNRGSRVVTPEMLETSA